MAEESTARDVADQFKDIARDLFNIEVNTILRDKITAQKMPGVRNALMDIGIEYFEILETAEEAYGAYLGKNDENSKDEKSKDENLPWSDHLRLSLGFYTQDEYEARKPDGEFLIVDPHVCDRLKGQFGGFQAFAIMRAWADRFLKAPGFLQHLRSVDDLDKKNSDEKKRILSVLPRIKENADMLKGMFIRICRREVDKRTKNKLTARLEELKNGGKLTPEAAITESWEMAKDNKEEIDLEFLKSLTNQYTRSEIISINAPLEPKMDHSERVMVRKIWEVGTEVIAMQTTIQVDGDVITRLNPNYFDHKSYDKLSGYHNDGVNIALKYWGSLVSIAKELMDRVGKGLRG